MTDFLAVYLHGFLSSANSEKGRWFKNKNLQEQLFSHWVMPSYTQASPKQTVAELSLLIDKELQRLQSSNSLMESINGSKPLVLIGSSLGGFYVEYLAHKYQLPYIMINPALNPCALFESHTGSYQNTITNEKVEIDQEFIDELQAIEIKKRNRKLSVLVLLEKDDEVIDVDFILSAYANNQFSRQCLIHYSGGDHRFIHLEDAWRQIRGFLEKNATN